MEQVMQQDLSERIRERAYEIGSQAAIAMARQINIGWPPSKKFCPACAPRPWQRLPQSGSEAGQRLNDPGGGRTELQIAFRTSYQRRGSIIGSDRRSTSRVSGLRKADAAPCQF